MYDRMAVLKNRLSTEHEAKHAGKFHQGQGQDTASAKSGCMAAILISGCPVPRVCLARRGDDVCYPCLRPLCQGSANVASGS